CGDTLESVVPVFSSGSTFGAGDDHQESCVADAVPEREFAWTAPANGTYRISLEGSEYDTLLYVREGGCEGMELACNDDTITPFGLELWSSIEVDLLGGQTISIFVEGFDGTGDFDLAITAI